MYTRTIETSMQTVRGPANLHQYLATRHIRPVCVALCQVQRIRRNNWILMWSSRVIRQCLTKTCCHHREFCHKQKDFDVPRASQIDPTVLIHQAKTSHHLALSAAFSLSSCRCTVDAARTFTGLSTAVRTWSSSSTCKDLSVFTVTEQPHIQVPSGP